MDSNKSRDTTSRRSNSILSLKSVRKLSKTPMGRDKKIRLASRSTLRRTPLKLKTALHAKYSIDPAEFNAFLVDTMSNNSQTSLVSAMKDCMIYDYIDEFLKREYSEEEAKERLPQIANYYKNYLKFFCKPVFMDFPCNTKLKAYSDIKAKIYYNSNYAKNETESDQQKEEFPTLINAKEKKAIEAYKMTPTDQSSKFVLDETINQMLTRQSQEESFMHIVSHLDGIKMNENFTKKVKKIQAKKVNNYSTEDKTIEVKKKEKALSPNSRIQAFFTGTKKRTELKTGKLQAKSISKITAKRGKSGSKSDLKTISTRSKGKYTSISSKGGFSKLVEFKNGSKYSLKSSKSKKKISNSRNFTSQTGSVEKIYGEERSSSLQKSLKQMKNKKLLYNCYQLGKVKKEDSTGIKRRKNNSQEIVMREGLNRAVTRPIYDNLMSFNKNQMTVRNKKHPEIRIKSREGNVSKKVIDTGFSNKTPIKGKIKLFKKL